MTFSKMMLGTVQFGLNYGIANREGQPSVEKVKGILRLANELGINTLDTAAAYGTSEEVLGQALVETDLSEHFQIITKIPVFPKETSEKDAELIIRDSLMQSLRRLHRDRLTAVLVHNEQNIPQFSILERVCAEGIAEGVGISLDSQDSLTRQKDVLKRVKYVQLPSNLLDRRFDSFIDSAPDRGVFVFARSACLQGLLLMPAEEIPLYLHPILSWRAKAEKIAFESGISIKEFCFRYLITLSGVSSIVFGVDNEDQLRENCTYAQKGALPLETILAVRREIPLLEESLIRPFLWKKRAEALQNKV